MLMEYAFYFEIDSDEAAKLVGSMAHTIADNWQGLAREVGMSGPEIGITALRSNTEKRRTLAHS
ncbi:hypothetical protein V2V90_23310 (plasmid) [Agrobacterium leguminum]|uniref:hypothetical protein n=1 Tax=Agrobacterium leguminum TaxID=2792015 RepID=UPI0030CB15B1